MQLLILWATKGKRDGKFYHILYVAEWIHSFSAFFRQVFFFFFSLCQKSKDSGLHISVTRLDCLEQKHISNCINSLHTEL